MAKPTPPPPPSPQRRAAEREFLQLLIATGHTLAARTPDPEKRQAATRVTRRLRLLLL
jgi:hypothetical protein